jgi:hypothetical protein
VCTLLRHLAALNLGGPLTIVLDHARYQLCAQVMALAASLEDGGMLLLSSLADRFPLLQKLFADGA